VTSLGDIYWPSHPPHPHFAILVSYFAVALFHFIMPNNGLIDSLPFLYKSLNLRSRLIQCQIILAFGLTRVNIFLVRLRKQLLVNFLNVTVYLRYLSTVRITTKESVFRRQFALEVHYFTRILHQMALHFFLSTFHLNTPYIVTSDRQYVINKLS